MGLTDEVKTSAMAMGAHLVGIAPVERFHGAPTGHHPCDLLPGARSVISVGIRVFQTVLDSHAFGYNSDDMRVGVLGTIPYDPTETRPEESQLGYVQEFMYTQHHTIINMRLDAIACVLAHLLTEKRYTVLPLPASGWPEEGYDDVDRAATGVPTRTGIDSRPHQCYALFSHRVAAVLAGLGDWGLNGLVITPQYGPRVRLNSVITTAELEVDDVLKDRVCLGEDCMACLQSRPCWGELQRIELGERIIPMAQFLGCKAGLEPRDLNRPEICRRGGWGTLPHMRHCIGVCPIGANSS